MKPKKRDMSYNELQRFLAKKYNDYQNVSIYDSNYNYLDLEISEELFQDKEFLDLESKRIK